MTYQVSHRPHQTQRFHPYTQTVNHHHALRFQSYLNVLRAWLLPNRPLDQSMGPN
jgi:hypothetical protein